MPSAAQPIDYSIWSFCFAKGKVPRDFIEGAPVGSNQGLLEIPMIYSAISFTPQNSKRKVYMVDTGFASGKSMTGRAFADFETPDIVLAKVELAPTDVEAILLTHLHFDHVGNIDAFPNAMIYVQQSEYDGWKRALRAIDSSAPGKTNWALSSMNLDDIVRFERAMSDGRVTFIDGSLELSPGLTLHLAADTHTFGSQWVEVATPSGAYAIAGDAIVSYSNVERMWPPGYHQGCSWNLLQCYERIKSLVGKDRLDRIVPGHDMELFRRLPNWMAGNNPVAEVLVAANERHRATVR